MTSLVLKQLIESEPDKSDIKDNNWKFSDFTAEQSVEFFLPLVRNHLIITIEYQVLCSQISSHYQKQSLSEETLIAALAMNDLLVALYAHYLSVPREVKQLLDDREKIAGLLQQQSPNLVVPDLEITRPDIRKFNSSFIRGSTSTSNFPRLFLSRLKRWLNFLAPLLKNLEQYALFVVWMDKFANPFLSYLAWAFFLPRLLTNCYLMLCHLFPNKKNPEAKIPWWARVEAQWQRKWFELGNDSVWMVAGLLSCFVLIGPLSSVGFYVTLALYGYDIGLAVIRAVVELNKLYQLRKTYQQLPLNNKDDYLNFLEKRIRFEEKRLGLAVINTSVLMLAMALLMPIAIATNPFIPLAGISLLVITTVVHYVLLNMILEKKRPIDNLNKVVAVSRKFGIFSNEKPTDNSDCSSSDRTNPNPNPVMVG